MQQDTSGVIRFAAVSGTLLIVGLATIYLILMAIGLGDQDRSFFWDGIQTLARVLLPVVLGAGLLLFFDWGWLKTAGIPPWVRQLVLGSGGLALGFGLAYALKWNSTRVPWQGFADLWVGLCLAVLMFSPKSMRGLAGLKPLESSEAEREDLVLLIYFGLVLGILLFLVFFF